ncbi:hypothetical protein [Streptosporangium sp. NPDC048865]|uniref:hypothetical protein n=1 Tax=Streptosporangium sp. NPDC048865 TaxID=3155766 RepID=UPI00343FBA8E
MSGEWLPVLGTALGAFLGGGLLKALFDYLTNRRKTSTDFALGTLTSLQDWNTRLQKKIAELEAELDQERRARRELEDRVARLEREHPEEEDPL